MILLHSIIGEGKYPLQLVLDFRDDRLYSARIEAQLFSDDEGWRNWSTDKEDQRKEYLEQLLATWLGNEQKFPWGLILPDVDATTGHTGIRLVYRAHPLSNLG